MGVLIARAEGLKKASMRRNRGLKLVANELWKGESEWTGGEWREGLVYLSEEFEVGVALPHHEQDLHAHAKRYELYVFFGRGRLKYLEDGEERVAEAGPGDVLIVEPGTFHLLELEEGLAYAILVGCEKGDKVVLKKD